MRSAATEPTLPNPCTTTRAPFELAADARQSLTRRDHAPPARRLAPAQRSAHRHGLPRHHRRDRMAVMHGIRIHDPRHHALVGVDVRRRYIRVGAQRFDDARRVAPGHPLELTHRHGRRIAHDATLGAAEGNVHDGAFPGHPRRQRFDLFQGHVQVEPDAAFGRAARRVVQHAVAGVHVQLAVVAQDGHRLR